MITSLWKVIHQESAKVNHRSPVIRPICPSKVILRGQHEGLGQVFTQCLKRKEDSTIAMCPLVQIAQEEGGSDCVPSPHEPGWSYNFSQTPGLSTECQSLCRFNSSFTAKKDTCIAQDSSNRRWYVRTILFRVRGDHG